MTVVPAAADMCCELMNEVAMVLIIDWANFGARGHWGTLAYAANLTQDIGIP
jgi:hypothetical protein